MDSLIRFVKHGKDCALICPEKAAPGRPWVWRAEFLGAFDYVDRDLLKRGWHIAYCQLSNLYGCPQAIEDMKVFHDYVVAKYDLNAKADLFGFSRGGLYAFNYALKYPKDINVIYLDAPVLDLLSWPGGFGEAERQIHEWEECKACYGLDEEHAAAFKQSPRYRLNEFVRLGLPVLLVAGDSDTVVPYEENGKLLAEALTKAGADCKVVVKPGIGHHPHSLEDPQILTDFIVKHHF